MNEENNFPEKMLVFLGKGEELIRSTPGSWLEAITSHGTPYRVAGLSPLFGIAITSLLTPLYTLTAEGIICNVFRPPSTLRSPLP